MRTTLLLQLAHDLSANSTGLAVAAPTAHGTSLMLASMPSSMRMPAMA